MTASKSPRQAVLRSARFALAHTPGLVRHGSKPSRELVKDHSLLPAIQARLRSFEDAASYPPHRVLLGDLYPDELWDIDRPWHQAAGDSPYCGAHGQLIPEEEFYALLKLCDPFDLVSLEEEFGRSIATSGDRQTLLGSDLPSLAASAHPLSRIESMLDDPTTAALPLNLGDGRVIGSIASGHGEDASLTADILLENLACKATAVAALRKLLRDEQVEPGSIDYVINCGEEAVGDRYQRGGGNLAKAVAEACGCNNATGADVKAFCCGPVHGLGDGGGLGKFGPLRAMWRWWAVARLAKLGMKFQSHLDAGMPLLEDLLVGVAVLVSADDGVHPVLRLDSIGRHSVGAGSSQQAILGSLVAEPLLRLGLGFRDVDKYATELHNPEITEPAASGDVPAQNYRLIAALAVLANQIAREDMPQFVRQHGMPGFSPTQGHIASAVPFLGHAIERIMAGDMQRAMFLAKGSLFLGRMTHMSDGMSFILERNPSS